MTLVRSAPTVLLLALGASCSAPRDPVPALDERHVITVDGTVVRYNGKLLDWNATVEDWEKVLGRRSRQAGDVAVWDQLGVFVFQTRGPRPGEFAVMFGRVPPTDLFGDDPLPHWPTSMFRGRLLVDGMLIHSGLTLEGFKREATRTRFRRGYLPTLYNYDVDHQYVALQFSYRDTLMEFSISAPFPAGASDPQPRR